MKLWQLITLILIWLATGFFFGMGSSAKLAERNHCKIDHHEYQIELEFDTVLIYDNNRFVGSYIVTTPLSPIDSILGDDNR